MTALSDIAERQEGARMRSRIRRRELLMRLSPWVVAIALFGLWELTTQIGIIDSRALSRPGEVLGLAWEWTVSGFIWPHIVATLTEVGIGYVLGTLLGLAVAFLFFLRPHVALVFEPFVTLLNAIPRGVLAPLAVVAFGLGLASKIVLVVLVVFLITLLNLHTGLREVSQTIVNNARVMGASRNDLIRHVYLPASLVWIVTAMRISIGHAFTTAIVCELLGATVGLGWIIAVGQSTIKPAWMMAGLLFAGIITVLIDFFVLGPLERKGSHWRVF
jgi:NitT/TauT family transport system permease protein